MKNINKNTFDKPTKVFKKFKLYLLIIMCVLCANVAFSQITISIKNQPIREILKEIEKKSEYKFFYNSSFTALNTIKDIDIINKPIEAILQQLFKDTGISWEKKENNLIVLTSEEMKKQAVADKTNIKVSGIVVDEKGLPIPGVHVLVKGTSTGESSDMDGKYTINIPNNNAVLQFQFVGFKTAEIPVGTQTTINVTLTEDIGMLGEVVVVGYGSTKKVNLTGAVSTVKMDEVLGDRPVSNVMSALQGSVPGLVITGSSSPSGTKNYNIRGITSISSGLDNTYGSPLVLVDNVPADIDMINPEDIESVTLLKDAASAAIYGARAAFGVILVTTKKSKVGTKFQISYNNSFGFEKSINRPQQVPIIDFLKAYKDAGFTGGKWYAQSQDIDAWIGYIQDYQKNPNSLNNVTDNGIYIPEENNPSKIRYYLKDYDKYDNMLDPYGFTQSHYFSTAGSSERVSYRMSFGYYNNEGILVGNNDNYNRISVSSYVAGDVTSWLNQSLDIRYAKGKTSEINNSGGIWDLRLSNIIPEGEMYSQKGTMLPLNTPRNFILNSYPTKKINENPRIFSRTTIKPFEGFDVVLEYTYDKMIFDQKKYDKPFTSTSVQLEEKTTPQNSKYQTFKTTTDYNAINIYGTYSKSFNDAHNVKVMGGYNQESRYYEDQLTTRNDMINIDNPSLTGAYGETQATDKFREYSIRSAFFRVNYDYKSKYLLEVNGRYDGSSKFPKDTRFGFFPSFSLGWQVAQEDFMSWSKSWLNTFKIRGSWGEIGNQAVSEYGFIPEMTSELANWIDPSTSTRPTTLVPPGLVRRNFTWETVSTADIGFDMSILKNRLQTTFDWYQRDTKGMLAPGMELPAVVGAKAPNQNAADLRTRGWELSITWKDRINEWGYHVGFNVFDSRSEITKFDGNEKGVLTSSSGWNNERQRDNDQYRVGYQFGDIWGYESNGYYTVDDFEDTQSWKLKPDVTSIKGISVRPGDVKFKNLRDAEGSQLNQIDEGNNTLENPGDRKVIGNSTPRYQFGFNGGVSYKGFDLTFFFQGTAKRDVWISDDLRWGFNSGSFGTIFYNQLDYWKPQDAANGNWQAVNPNAEWHRIYGEKGNAGSNQRIQSKYLLDGSYIRLKNVTLSYNFQKNILEKLKLNSLKLFVSVENLHTWTKLPKGYDPERLTWQYPFYRTISFGANISL